MDHCLETEVLIIGCGIAGGTAALQLADAGIPVTVITRSRQPEESNTLYAQGGIIYRGEADSPELLAEDIVRAGAGFSNPRAVRILAEEGPELVKKILLDELKIHIWMFLQRSDQGILDGLACAVLKMKDA